MGRRIKAFSLILLAVCALAGCRPERRPAAGGQPDKGDAPELAMAGVRAVSYDVDGIGWVLRSPLVSAYTEKERVQAIDVDVDFYRAGERSSTFVSDAGWLNTQAGDHAVSPRRADEDWRTLGPGDMFLSGNVVLTSTDGARLYTDWLIYRQVPHIVRSTAPVRLIREDSITTGVGLEASADLSRAEIYDQTVVLKERSGEKGAGR